MSLENKYLADLCGIHSLARDLLETLVGVVPRNCADVSGFVACVASAYAGRASRWPL